MVIGVPPHRRHKVDRPVTPDLSQLFADWQPAYMCYCKLVCPVYLSYLSSLYLFQRVTGNVDSSRPHRSSATFDPSRPLQLVSTSLSLEQLARPPVQSASATSPSRNSQRSQQLARPPLHSASQQLAWPQLSQLQHLVRPLTTSLDLSHSLGPTKFPLASTTSPALPPNKPTDVQPATHHLRDAASGSQFGISSLGLPLALFSLTVLCVLLCR